MIQVDAVIVGAGAAGLSAARVLERSGFTIRILEAKDRVGGRAFTDRESFSIPFDHGALGWTLQSSGQVRRGRRTSNGGVLFPLYEHPNVP